MPNVVTSSRRYFDSSSNIVSQDTVKLPWHQRLHKLWQRFRGPAPTNSLLTPILLPYCGRNGSTLVMQLLNTSPEIIMGENGCFEERYLTYLLRWAQLPEGQRYVKSDWNVDDILLPDNCQTLGPSPWQKLLSSVDEPLWPGVFQLHWQRFSQRLTQQQRDGKRIRYYAEKTFLWVQKEILELLPLKSIYTIRDPRDVWLSIKAFDEKRAFFGFGRRSDESESDYFERFLDLQKSKLQLFLQIVESESEIIVHYEHLVADLARAASRLGNWLGVTLDASPVVRQSSRYQHHMTSFSPGNSVGRWRHEMSSELRQRFVTCMGSQLQQLGYDV